MTCYTIFRAKPYTRSAFRTELKRKIIPMVKPVSSASVAKDQGARSTCSRGAGLSAISCLVIYSKNSCGFFAIRLFHLLGGGHALMGALLVCH